MKKWQHVLGVLGLLAMLTACGGAAEPAGSAGAVNSQANLIRNGDFSQGETGWQVFANTSKGVTFETSLDDYGRYCVWVGEGGEVAWDVFLYQESIALSEDVTYDLSFKVATSQDKTANFKVKVGQAQEPYEAYAYEAMQVSGGEGTTKTLSFSPFASDGAAKLEFHLGANPYGQYLCFDDITLSSRGGEPSPEPDPEPSPEPDPEPESDPDPNPSGGNAYGGTLAPSQGAADALIGELYAKWKRERLAYAPTKGLQEGEIILTSNSQFGGGMVSEGLGYGLLLSVYNDDRATFDGLWKFVERNLRNYEGGEGGLLPWRYDSNSQVTSGGNATDGDLDIAFALVVADKKGWGYGAEAKTYIANVLRYSVGDGSNGVPNNMLKRGYWQQDPQAAINTSYVAPGYFKVFADYTGEERWLEVRDYNYDILRKGLEKHTLLPHDTDVEGNKIGYHEEYDVDAARGPWRLATDYAWYGDDRAKALLDKYNSFFESVGLGNLCSNYYTDGNRETNWCGSKAGWMIGGAASAQLASDNAQSRGEAWDALTTAFTGNYYSFELMQLGVLLASGRFYNPLQ